MEVNNVILRPSQPGDEDALKSVWKAAFHDEDDFLDLFFEKYYKSGTATLMEANGKPVSCIFTLSGTEYLEDGCKPLPCPYVYSLGTLPEYRGFGFGAKVIQESVRRGFSEQNAQWVTLLPAEESLYRWYEGILGSRTAFWAHERLFDAAELPAVPTTGFTANHVDAASYGRLREIILGSKPHVRFSEELLAWQEQSCRHFGGGMYLLELDGAVGCAAVECYGELTDVKELLLPDAGIDIAAAVISRIHPASQLRVRTPVFWGGSECGQVREYVVAIPKDAAKMPSSDSWWGLVFD